MVKKPSRTRLDFKYIPPRYVKNVFSFIDQLLNKHRLSVDWFKQQTTKVNPIELSFICYYCKLYFNDKGSNIYLYKWLEQQRQVFDDNDEPELYDELDNQISVNQQKLLELLPFIQTISERRAKDLLRFEVSQSDYLNFYSDKPINSRIPLFYNRKRFKQLFFDIWQELYSKDQVEEMYQNSFQFILNDIPPKTLFLEIDRKMVVYAQIAYTIKEYKEHINRQTENMALKYNKALEQINGLRKDFSKTYDYESIVRLPFAYMMYNTFPDVRDGFQYKLIKEPDYSWDLYFENIFKNFSKRKYCVKRT